MIVCLEGINGAGKSTLARLLTERWLAGGGELAEVVDATEASHFGQEVRSAIMNADGLNEWAENLAFASARIAGFATIAERFVGVPGRLCVIERWSGAVIAYGRAVGTSESILQFLESALMNSAAIDTMLLVDVSGEIAAGRLRQQADTNRFETKGDVYLERVRQEYLTWARGRGVRIIGGDLSIERLRNEVDQIIDGLTKDCTTSA